MKVVCLDFPIEVAIRWSSRMYPGKNGLIFSSLSRIMQAKIRDKQTKERYYFHYFYILVYTQVGSYILVVVIDSIMHIFHKE